MRTILLKIKHLFQKIFKGYSDEVFKYLDAFIKLDRIGYPLTLEKNETYVDFNNEV